MSVAEWLIMAFIFFSGILQEFLIKLFTPAGIVDAKSLHLVSHSLKFKSSIERGRFLVGVYGDYVLDGVLTEQVADRLCEETVRTSEKYSVDDVYARYSTKNKPTTSVVNTDQPVLDTGYSEKVEQAMQSIDKILKEENS